MSSPCGGVVERTGVQSMHCEMALQVHAVMQDAQDIDLVLCTIDPKNHKMPTGAPIAGYMQRVISSAR